MALAARISSAELTDQVLGRFENQALEARLINAPGITYEPGVTNDTNFLTFEVTPGLGGYQRQVIAYYNTDVTLYGDGGVGLTERATTFAHDGGSDPINFTHAVLVWGNGSAASLGAPTATPSSGNDGTYTNIPTTTLTGGGSGLTVDLEISGSGTVFTLTINNLGGNYADGDSLAILDGALAGIGAITAGAGDLVFPIATSYVPPQAGQIFSVAKTSSPVLLTAGNEAVFYWNIKQFGFYNVGA